MKPATFMSPPAVADQLGVKPSKVIGWIERGELRAANLADRLGKRPRYRIDPADLADFLRVRSAASVAITASRTRRLKPRAKPVHKFY